MTVTPVGGAYSIHDAGTYGIPARHGDRSLARGPGVGCGTGRDVRWRDEFVVATDRGTLDLTVIGTARPHELKDVLSALETFRAALARLFPNAD